MPPQAHSVPALEWFAALATNNLPGGLYMCWWLDKRGGWVEVQVRPCQLPDGTPQPFYAGGSHATFDDAGRLRAYADR